MEVREVEEHAVETENESSKLKRKVTGVDDANGESSEINSNKKSRFDDDDSETVDLDLVNDEETVENNPENDVTVTEMDNTVSSTDETVVILDEESSEQNDMLAKSKSIEEDANTIASLLDISDVKDIVRRLKAVRKKPNRVEFVINHLLEMGDDVCEVVQTRSGGSVSPEKSAGKSSHKTSDQSSSTRSSDQRSNQKKHDLQKADTVQDMLADIEKLFRILKQKRPDLRFDHNTAYLLLESNLKKPDRVNIVVKSMLETDEQTQDDDTQPQVETSVIMNDEDRETSVGKMREGGEPTNKVNRIKKSSKEEMSVIINDEDMETSLGRVQQDAEPTNKGNRTETSEDNVEQGAANWSKNNSSSSPDCAIQSSSNDENDFDSTLFEDVEIVMKKMPNADANRVLALLESRKNDKNRIKSVIEVLIETSDSGDEVQIIASGQTSNDAPRVLDESVVNNDPLYKDMLKISRMFPNIGKNDIYALCETYHDRPNRVQIIMEELLDSERSDDSQEVRNKIPRLDTDSSAGKTPKKDPEKDSANGGKIQSSNQEGQSSSSAKPGSSSADGDNKAGEKNKPEISPLEELQQNVEDMMAVFPDCDPDYLYYMLEQRFKDPQRVLNLSAQMLETRNYPKLKERLEKEKRAANIRRIKKMEFKMDGFLQMFPDPITHFSDETRPVSDSYKEHGIAHLKNMFPGMHVAYIQEVYEKTHKNHFYPAFVQLENESTEAASPNVRRGSRRKSKKKFRQTPRTAEVQMPDVPDEYFYKELMFTRNVAKIKEFLENREEMKRKRLEQAREAGQLNECGCCFDDEVLFEDMLACPDGHLFCKECIRRSSEELIGQTKIKFPCLGGECKTEFSMVTLQQVLSSKMFSNLLRKIQEEEIRQADIPDLVTCPFCSFATIMPDESDKVLKCLNSECLKESCRLCKEPNHVPLRCEEVEKQGETNMRTFIEQRITEAMIRTCWKCKKRFFKTEGCNKMTCVCGASMCYVCKKPIKDYSHFGPSGCPQDTDVRKLHMEEMEKAGVLAKKKYEEEHPELAQKSLKYDPLKELKKAKKKGGANNPNPGGGGGGMFGGMWGMLGYGGGGYNDNDDDDSDDDSEDEYDEYGDGRYYDRYGNPRYVNKNTT